MAALKPRSMERTTVLTAVVISAILLVIGVLHYYRSVDSFTLTSFFFTSDQQGQRLFRQKRYSEAAERFVNPEWQAAAFYRAGEFKRAAGIYAGMTSAEAVFNHGNAFVMQGKYADAVARYDRALSLRPNWTEASVNRRIAAARAERLKKEGGDMTGGMLGADEITFEKGKGGGQKTEEIVGAKEVSDAEMRAIWLRRVQTKPADFLRAKFAYQYSRSVEGKE